MKIDKKMLAIQLLALIGLGLSIKLAMIFHTANFDKYALSSFCSINDFIDCDGAARTRSAQFIGLPLAWWGIFFYIIILFLSIVENLKKVKFLKFLEVFKEPFAYISTLGTIAFTCSMVLAGISLFGIKKLCILCFATYFIDLIIATVAADGLFKNILKSFKTTFFDFIDGVKSYTKTFIVLLIIFVSFLIYSGTTLSFVPHIKKHNSIMKYRKIERNPYRVEGNILGTENADVVVELYSDYVCPLCYIHNIMLHQIVKEFKNVKVVHHNLPFDRACNDYISFNMHPGACFMSRVAIAARNQGKYWGMSSLLYEKQPKKLEDLVKLSDELNLDIKKLQVDLESKETYKEIEKEIKKGVDLGIDATPTMYINGERIVGVKPYYELKDLMIKYGAKRK